MQTRQKILHITVIPSRGRSMSRLLQIYWHSSFAAPNRELLGAIGSWAIRWTTNKVLSLMKEWLCRWLIANYRSADLGESAVWFGLEEPRTIEKRAATLQSRPFHPRASHPWIEQEHTS